ncbi:glycosyltransferase family 2 protein [Pseudomonas sp. QTF5]|uniref:glycosyltransferase family 2 protein n=1 Tax=Pseudomonas sp. QTF5 TaxID=1435425 RepID=UPI0004BC1DD2|nr:glycosyltransferase family 2 protein [Pseudomonas sp. QTF5]
MANSSGSVTILLSTYNGEKYLREQIDSIVQQQYQDWVLLVRDDGSSDSTLEIVKSYSVKDARVQIIADGYGNQGPAGSFIKLLACVETEYFMFCDQDDVWLPNKVYDSIKILKSYDGPHLVFTDLKVVDEHLEEMSSSFMEKSRFDPIKGVNFSKLLIQNVVVGCTIAANKKLLEESKLSAFATPNNIMMHDWWLALVASSLGKITYLDKPTILYRQHGGNCLGAKDSGFRHYLRLLYNQKPWLKAQKYLNRVILQAASFNECYGWRVTPSQRKLLSLTVGLRSGSVVLGLSKCFSSGISMHKLDRNVALLLSFIFGRLKDWKAVES